MSNWTPGPWEIEQGRAPHVKEIKGPNREAICATHNWIDSDPIEESRANAHLIAAAPRLHDALSKAIQYVPLEPINCGGLKCREPWCEACSGEEDAAAAIERAEQELQEFCDALNKARGEEQ